MCVVCRDGQIFLLENIRSGQDLLACLLLDTTCFHEKNEFLENVVNNPHHYLSAKFAPGTVSAPFCCTDLGRTWKQVNRHSKDFWTSFQIQNLCQHSPEPVFRFFCMVAEVVISGEARRAADGAKEPGPLMRSHSWRLV